MHLPKEKEDYYNMKHTVRRRKLKEEILKDEMNMFYIRTLLHRKTLERPEYFMEETCKRPKK